MPLVNPLGMLQAARQGGYCVGAFNLVDFLTLKAIVEAAEQQRSPVILQTSSATVKQLGRLYLSAFQEAVLPMRISVLARRST